jgi:hypothetical protein
MTKNSRDIQKAGSKLARRREQGIKILREFAYEVLVPFELGVSPGRRGGEEEEVEVAVSKEGSLGESFR